MADVNKIIDKKFQELTARVARLEARLGVSGEDRGDLTGQPEHPRERPDSATASDKKSESTIHSDGKTEARKSAEHKPVDQAAANTKPDAPPKSEKPSYDKPDEEANARSKPQNSDARSRSGEPDGSDSPKKSAAVTKK